VKFILDANYMLCVAFVQMAHGYGLTGHAAEPATGVVPADAVEVIDAGVLLRNLPVLLKTRDGRTYQLSFSRNGGLILTGA
jgi:hypothetical protein